MPLRLLCCFLAAMAAMGAGAPASAQGDPHHNPPAVISYGKLPLPVRIDDPFVLFDEVTKLMVKDPFEKTSEYEARVAGSDVLRRDYRFLIEPEHIQVFPFPDQDLYYVATGIGISPLRTDPPVLKIATHIDAEHEGLRQNGFGAVANVTSSDERDFRVLITNWSQLGAGLIWSSNDDPSLHLGIPFRKPPAELIELMKNHQLALMIRVQIVHLDQALKESSSSQATINSPYETYTRRLTVPVELKAVTVVSADHATAYALWARDFKPSAPAPQPAR